MPLHTWPSHGTTERRTAIISLHPNVICTVKLPKWLFWSASLLDFCRQICYATTFLDDCSRRSPFHSPALSCQRDSVTMLNSKTNWSSCSNCPSRRTTSPPQLARRLGPWTQPDRQRSRDDHDHVRHPGCGVPLRFARRRLARCQL